MKLRKVLSAVQIEDGGRIPKGYGLAYHIICERKAVFYPIPINLLVNWYRKLKQRTIIPSLSRLERLQFQAYASGQIRGARMEREGIQREMDIILADLKQEREAYVT